MDSIPRIDVQIGSARRAGAFEGVGYHAFFTLHDREMSPAMEALHHARWRELSPSFARVTHAWTWNTEYAVRQLQMMRDAGTSVYLTTWDPPDLPTASERDAYADRVAELLFDLVIRRGLDNVRWYCMTNELSITGQRWGTLYKDLPTFADYHRRIHRALQERKIPVGLLATDASPVQRWDSIDWAMNTMDDVTAAYGGHHYVNDHLPDDPDFYAWFRDRVTPYAQRARSLGKPFLIGEFGPRQYQGERYGFANWDGCAWFDTSQEPAAAVQTVEAAMAAIDAGADGVGYWTFSDFPDEYSPTRAYANKWGTFRWDETFSTRPVYYAIGLLSRFLRGPGTVHDVDTGDPLVRAVAVHGGVPARYSVAVINRRPVPIQIRLLAPAPRSLERIDAYVFDPADAEAYGRSGSLLNSHNTLARDARPEFQLPAGAVAVIIELITH